MYSVNILMALFSLNCRKTSSSGDSTRFSLSQRVIHQFNFRKLNAMMITLYMTQGSGT